LFHLDLYRLETPEQIAAAGLEEFLQSDGVTVIEWAEKMANEEWRLKNEEKTRRTVFAKIEILGESERKIIYDDLGA